VATKKTLALLIIGFAVAIGVIGYMAMASSSYSTVAQAVEVCRVRPGATLMVEIHKMEVYKVKRLSTNLYEMVLRPEKGGGELVILARGEQASKIVGPVMLAVGQEQAHVLIPGKGKAVIEIKCLKPRNGTPYAIVLRVLESCHKSYSAPQVQG